MGVREGAAFFATGAGHAVAVGVRAAKAQEGLGEAGGGAQGGALVIGVVCVTYYYSGVLIRVMRVAPFFGELPRAKCFERVDVEMPIRMATAALFEECEEIIDVLAVEGAIERIVAEGCQAGPVPCHIPQSQPLQVLKCVHK